MTQLDLPAGWATVAIAEVLSCVETGKRPKGGAVKDTSGVLSISAEHMDSTGGIDTSIPRFVPKKFYETMTTGRLQPGDVLVVKDGATTGKTAYFSDSSDGRPIVVNEHVFICRPLTAGITPRWLFYCLWGEPSQAQIRACFRGSAQGGIIRSFVNEVTLPLPPLPEQHRIVAEIETQFTRLDASVAALRRAQANLKRYRASVLKDACEGRLVPTEAELARSEGREYEPADVLLERILAERRVRWESQEKRRGKYREPSAPDTSALPTLPEGWVWATVERLIVEPLANGRSVKTVGEGFPVLRLTALREGEIDETEHKIGKWTAQQAEPFLIQKGDFFVSRGSGSIRLVGIGGLVREVESAVAFPDTMIRFRLNEFVLKQYFSLVWNSYVVRAQVETSARTTAGIYKVNQQDLAAMTIPLPPLAEQRRIVAEVERRLSVAQQAEATVEASLARAERLRQSILKQAFSGRLVPQDPGDEPASVLLERIRAEREAEAQASSASKGKSGRGRKRATE